MMMSGGGAGWVSVGKWHLMLRVIFWMPWEFGGEDLTGLLDSRWVLILLGKSVRCC